MIQRSVWSLVHALPLLALAACGAPADESTSATSSLTSADVTDPAVTEACLTTYVECVRALADGASECKTSLRTCLPVGACS